MILSSYWQDALRWYWEGRDTFARPAMQSGFGAFQHTLVMGAKIGRSALEPEYVEEARAFVSDNDPRHPQHGTFNEAMYLNPTAPHALSAEGPDVDILQAKLARRVRHALAGLTDPQRAAIYLGFVDRTRPERVPFGPWGNVADLTRAADKAHAGSGSRLPLTRYLDALGERHLARETSQDERQSIRRIAAHSDRAMEEVSRAFLAGVGQCRS